MRIAQKGFTLTELLVVVLIVSILVGVGLPGYREFVQRSGRTGLEGSYSASVRSNLQPTI